MVGLRASGVATVFTGLVFLYVPHSILSARDRDIPRPEGWAALVGLVLIALGAVASARCIWDFTNTGRGTPLPFDAPRTHVRVGLYRWVRNPMYVGCLLVLHGEAALFWSWGLLVYAAAVAVVVYVGILVYEEPTLRRKFGDEYRQYCDDVPRLFPRVWRR